MLLACCLIYESKYIEVKIKMIQERINQFTYIYLSTKDSRESLDDVLCDTRDDVLVTS